MSYKNFASSLQSICIQKQALEYAPKWELLENGAFGSLTEAM